MSVLAFLFILFLIWIVPGLVRAFLLVYRVRKNARRVYEQMYGGMDGHQQEPPRRKGGWSAPNPRRKKIDPGVGEYVRFQEVDTTVGQHSAPSASGERHTEITVEQQVTDAEWEELP